MDLSVKIADRLELWPLERLKPYDRNARTHSPAQVEKLAASITGFGFTNPVLVDSKDGIIAGHGRLLAAKRLGLAEVPVIVLDHLSDAQRRAYILADNRLALDAGWDTGALEDEGFSLELTGFSDSELEQFLADDFSTTYKAPTDGVRTNFQTPAQIPARPAVEPLPENDPEKHWVGMPEFNQEDKTPYRQIIVSFASDQDALEFGLLIGQTVTPKTRSLWYPKAEIESYADKRYESEI